MDEELLQELKKLKAYFRRTSHHLESTFGNTYEDYLKEYLDQIKEEIDYLIEINK